MSELGLITVGTCAESPVALEVLFFHGLGGDAHASWGGPDESGYWPSWLLLDAKGVDVFSINYAAPKFHVNGKIANMPMYDKALEICDYLVSSGIGKKPLVVICHSLGGLLIKQILRVCQDSEDKNFQKLFENIRGVIFLATPHDGSGMADLVQCFPVLGSSKIVEAMEQDGANLRDLKAWFSKTAVDREIRIKSYYEMKPTNGVVIVGQNSANPDVHGSTVVAADADHVSIAKPTNSKSPVYRGVVQFIKDCAKDVAAPVGNNPRINFLDEEIDRYKVQLDRLDLDEKLCLGGRDFEIPDARRKREAFDKRLKKHAAQRSAQEFFTSLLSQVETRFRLHVYPHIVSGADMMVINSAIQEHIVNPITKDHGSADGVNAALIDEMIYYLTGLCNIRWHHE